MFTIGQGPGQGVHVVLSSDVKPTARPQTACLELDTGFIWVERLGAWVKNKTQDFIYADSIIESTNSTTAFATKVTLTIPVDITSMLMQTYIDWYFELGQGTNKFDSEVQILLDGVVIGRHIENFLDTTVQYSSVCGFAGATIGSGVHTVVIEFRRGAGGSAKIRNARIRARFG